MKILFVNPPVVRHPGTPPETDRRLQSSFFPLRVRIGLYDSCKFGVRAGSRWPYLMDQPYGKPHYPFIMAYAASMLNHNGFTVDLFDSMATDEYSYVRFLKRTRNWEPDIVVMEPTAPTYDVDEWMAREISQFAEVAFAGAHVSPAMYDNESVSYFLNGEYIYSALHMARTQNYGIYEPRIADLDKIPEPMRRFEGATRYYDPSIPTAKPQLQMYASKGCPFKCTFCLWPQMMYRGEHSVRQPSNVAKEIINCIDNYGFRSIFFDDDTFNIGDERVSKLCDYLKEIGLPWSMMGRLDTSPDWLFDKMVDSGCVGMRFGIETFNDTVRKTVMKTGGAEDHRNKLKRLCEEYPDLYLHVAMMRGLPGQSQADHKLDMHILDTMGFDHTNPRRHYQIADCQTYAGTRLHKEMNACKTS